VAFKVARALAGAVGGADGSDSVQSVDGNVWHVGHFLGPVPQMLLGIAMVMVLFENERNAVQENTLALSTLGADPRRLLSADDLLPSMQSALERLAGALSAGAPSSTSPSAGAVCCLRAARILRGIPGRLTSTGAGNTSAT
jgi:hypothetical protein